ncbi:MAG: efflux RND transporter permease subunit [Spirochaetales bacterium]|nr:efflux RND transporter permease subunit [Spirochaetales bacterium]
MKVNKGILGILSVYSINKYRIIYLTMIMITFVGLNIYKDLPRESKPEIIFPTVKVSVNYPGASPKDVEQLVTGRLESVLVNLPDLEFITSSSLAGRSEIQLDFFPESDLEANYESVSQSVDSVLKDLPVEAESPSIRISTTANRAFLVLSLSGEVEPIKLRDAASLLERRLLALEGVKELRLSGLYNEEIQISYFPAQLAEYGLNSDDILQTIKLNHKDTPAGDAELDGMQYYVRVLGAFGSVDEIRRMQIPLPGGGTRFLKDLAMVEVVPVSSGSISRRAVGLGSPDVQMLPSVTLSLYRDGGTDIVGPSREASAMLEEVAGVDLLADIDVQIIQDDAKAVRQDLDDVLENAFSGLLIVILVLYLFLGLREALITSLIIPFSMFISFIAMDLYGMTFNTMTLLAMIIALGLLVDNGIVIVESVVEHRRRGVSLIKAVKEGANEVAPSIFAATLTTMAAFIPLAMMDGRVGMIISVIPMTVIFIIGASLLVALTLTPAISSRWLNSDKAYAKKITEKHFSWKSEIIISVMVPLLFGWAFWVDGRPGILSVIMTLVMLLFMAGRTFFRYKKINAFEQISLSYKKLLGILLSHRIFRIILPSVLFMLLALVFLGISSGFFKIELFPIKDETALYAVITAPEYSTIENTDRITREAEQKLMTLDGVSSLYSEVGLTSSRDSQIVMNLLPPGERSWTTQKKIPELMMMLSSIPGAEITVGTQAGGKTANSPVQIKVRGEDLEELRLASEMVAASLSGVDGVRGVLSDWEKGFPEIQIIPKDIFASDAGVDATSIGAQVRAFLGGQIAGTVLEKEGEQELRLVVNPALLNSVEDLNKILIPLKNGDFIPITNVVDLIPSQGYGTIKHSQGVRTVTVMAQMLPDANIREIVEGFETNRLGAEQLPEGTSYQWAGEAADLDASFGSMIINFIIALVVVFLILAIQFNSFSQALVILLSVPMSIIGVFAGLMLTGNNFGLYAFMGVIALIGIVVNDAIVLVDTVKRLRSTGLTLIQALEEAGRSRFSPVLATSLTTIGGILPLAFKDANFAQLSISLISGLIASTVLTLIILPLIFYSVDSIKTKIQQIIPVFVDQQEDE